MASKRFSKRITRKIKRVLKENEARNIIEKEFGDNQGNKLKFRFDFNPHRIDEPTIQGGFNYGDNK